MATYHIELTEEQMRQLAEMSAMSLTILGQAMPDASDKRVDDWQRLCVHLLDSARQIPSLRRDMELKPDCPYWFFKRSYINDAFYADVIDEYRDTTFWAELVSRISEQTLQESLGPQRADALSDEDRTAMTSSLEQALWQEEIGRAHV